MLSVAAVIACVMTISFGAVAVVDPFASETLAFAMHALGAAATAAATLVGPRLVAWGRHREEDVSDVGPYRLESQLGFGGMGEVWSAHHRLLNRPAVVKFVRGRGSEGRGWSDAEARARFEREARATARLRSPHTVEVYDYGTTSNGDPFYVMERVDGVDLEALVEKHGPQSLSRTIHVLVQLCDALEEAHRAGVVHRDVKPSNVMLCSLGVEHDFVKVLDFGLAAEQPPAGRERVVLTARDRVIGTPEFLAPEMVTHPADVDGRTDLYSLGCLAFWLLTAEPVFSGTSAMEIVAAHLKDPPRALRSVGGAAIPHRFESLIMACLEKDPADRPESARALGDALRVLAVEHPWSPERRERWWHDYRSCAGPDEPPV